MRLVRLVFAVPAVHLSKMSEYYQGVQSAFQCDTIETTAAQTSRVLEKALDVESWPKVLARLEEVQVHSMHGPLFLCAEYLEKSKKGRAVVSLVIASLAEPGKVAETAELIEMMFFRASNFDAKVAAQIWRTFGENELKIVDEVVTKAITSKNRGEIADAATLAAAYGKNFNKEEDLVLACAHLHLWNAAEDIIFSAGSAELVVKKAVEMNEVRTAEKLALRFKDMISVSLRRKAILAHAESTFRKLSQKGQYQVIGKIVRHVKELGFDASGLALQVLVEAEARDIAVALCDEWQIPHGIDLGLAQKDAESRQMNTLKLEDLGFIEIPRPITRPASVVRAIQQLTEDSGEIIGLDAEWGNNGPVALLQLASFDHIYLFDMNILSGDDFDFTKLIETKKFVGFSVQNDVARLAKKTGFPTISPFLDLQVTAAELLDLKSPGLSVTIKHFFDSKSLDKTLQCSDWDKRPLSEQQCTYAALDAAVLPHLYQRLFS